MKIVVGVPGGKTVVSNVIVFWLEQPPTFATSTAFPSVVLPGSKNCCVLLTTHAPLFARWKMAGFNASEVAPGALGVTVYAPTVPFAVAVTLATPLAFVVAGFGVPSVAVAPLPAAFAVKVTAPPGRGLPPVSVRRAASACPKAVLIGAF